MRKRFLLLVPLQFLYSLVVAQDANYWSADYCAGGFLTPGSVIAKNGDSGVVFYNPALLAFNTKNAAAISGSVYHFQNTKIKDGAGTGLHLTSSTGSIIPLLVSNTIYLKIKGKPVTIAYALIHNPILQFEANQRRDDKFDVLDDSYSPGLDYFVGQYNVSNTANETTGMLAYGRQVTSRLAVGLSFNLGLRKQNFQLDYKARALINNPNQAQYLPVVTVSETYYAFNRNLGMGIKAGLAYDLAENQHIGLLISAPTIHIYGDGSIASDNVINNLYTGKDTIYLLANTRQTKLKSKWKMPLSAALGYSFDLGKKHFNFTTEYFVKVKEYDVITPKADYFIRPDTALGVFTPYLLRMKDVRKAILNFSVGINFPLREMVTGFCSVRTDFSYADKELYKNDAGIESNTAFWDLYHTELGANFKKRKFNLRAGLLLTYGSTKNYDQFVNFDNPNEGNLLLGDVGKTKATRFSAGLLLSYIHNF